MKPLGGRFLLLKGHPQSSINVAGPLRGWVRSQIFSNARPINAVMWAVRLALK